jgi:hypothetical protein
MNVREIAAPANRGILLDAVVVALNLLVMPVLARAFVRLGGRAGGGDVAAKWALALFFLGMLVLPAAGAVLRRWHFHQQRGSERRAREAEADAWGCLLNPVFYLCVSLTTGMAAAVLIAEQAFGGEFADRGEVFVPMILGVLVLGIVQTVLVYRYFEPPRQPPRGAFWRGRASAVLGDACIFVNMILFQVLWNVALSAPVESPANMEGLAARLFFLWFMSILIYFPPRIFYLPNDVRRPVGRLSILLATSSILLRQALGG